MNHITKKTVSAFLVVVFLVAGLGVYRNVKAETTNPVNFNANTITGVDDCTNKDCYQAFQGLEDALGEQFDSFGQAEDLTDFINALIGFAIGIAGVLAVVMIMYEGFLYMSTDNVTTKASARSRIVNTVGGFVLLLSIYTLFRTINPDLLVLMPRIDSVTLDYIPDRSNDQEFQETLDDLGGDNIPDTTDYSDDLFIAYLYHQQGEGGAPSILWAAKRGYSNIPSTTPFIKGSASKINNNMANNVNKSDMQKLIGTSEITPSNFLKYWRKKVEAAKQSSMVIPANIANELQLVASETGVPLGTLRAMCLIESRCKPPAADQCNSFGYCGLFQVSKAVFNKFGTGNNIYDYYANAYTGARYSLYHKQRYANHKPKID